MKNFLLILFLSLTIKGENTYSIQPANFVTGTIANYGVTKLNDGILFVGLDELLLTDFYLANIISDNKFGKVRKVKLLKQQIKRLGLPTYVERSNELIFPMSGNLSLGYYSKFNLFTGTLEGNKVKNVKRINFCHSGIRYNSPTVSSDGLTMIFSARKSGITKLYQTKRKTIKDNWQLPTLIKELSSFELTAPKLLNDSLLTFSGKSESNPEDRDIYFAPKVDGKWKPTRNWKELNSEYLDFGVVMVDSISGYYSSYRNGGEAQIYYFKME